MTKKLQTTNNIDTPCYLYVPVYLLGYLWPVIHVFPPPAPSHTFAYTPSNVLKIKRMNDKISFTLVFIKHSHFFLFN